MKYTEKTIREVDYNDLDYAINEFLQSKGVKKNFECVPENEWGNYESHSIDIEAEVDEYAKAEILQGKIRYNMREILNWMCAEGEIEEGEYLINISW